MSSQSVGSNWSNRPNQLFRLETAWTDDGSLKVLTINLPGFPREQLRLSLDPNEKTLIVLGQKTDGFNITRLNEQIRIPDGCSIRGVRARLANESLIIKFPKTL